MRFHRSDPTVAWLLDAGEPAIQYLTLINVLKEPPEDPEVIAVRKQFVAGRIVRQLLEQAPVHVYAKWRWNANGRWWKPPASSGSNVEAVDWGPSQPNLVVTLKALTVLSAVP